MNKRKFEFGKTELKFHGMRFPGDGMAPTASRIQDLREAKPPTTPSEVKSILGVANYSASFIKDLASISEPLSQLTRSSVPWEWTERHQTALDHIKQALTEKALGHYRPDWSTEVVVDASPRGLGAILRQHEPADDRQRHVVCFKSRTLADPEKQYSQIER